MTRSDKAAHRGLRILTNMTFWQSPEWVDRTTSIYDLRGLQSDPELHSWPREVWQLYRRAGAYDVVLTQGARESVAYGLLCALTGRRSRQIMTEVFLDPPKRSSPFWLLKNAAFRLVARRALGLITNSSHEVRVAQTRLHIPPARAVFVPLNTNVVDPAPAETDDGYVFAAGRSQRDYPTLLRAAPHLHRPVVIVCGRGDLAGVGIPPGVTVHEDLSRDRYLDLLRRSSVVAVPLLPCERSTGQVVVLEAMSYGKPVVCTRQPGTVDYVEHGVNGLLVESGDAAALARELKAVLEDPDLGRRLRDRALRDCKDRFSVSAHARNKLEAVIRLSGLGRLTAPENP